MKLKKIVNAFLSCVLAGALLAGCGQDGEQHAAVDKPANNFSGAEVKLGVIAPMNTNEEKLGNLFSILEEKTALKGSHHLPKFFDSLKLMQMGIDSGAIDQISVYKCVADYLITANDAKYEIVENNSLGKITHAFCFAVRKDDAELKAELDKTIDTMKSDGTLDKFVSEYITEIDVNDIPKVNIPVIDGADTIKVGITGDLPPLDLILADNSPAGFNTAMLAEIANRLGKNIEIVQIESGARAAALNSKLIDVVFWAVVPFGNNDIPADFDKPEGLDLSTPYFKDNVTHIKLRSDK